MVIDTSSSTTVVPPGFTMTESPAFKYSYQSNTAAEGLYSLAFKYTGPKATDPLPNEQTPFTL